MATSLALCGCGNSNLSYVRVVNASPGLDKFHYTVQIGQTQVAYDIPYGTVGEDDKGKYTGDTSGHYRSIASGLQEVYVYYQTAAHSLNPANYNFVSKVHYTIVMIDPASAAHHLVLPDNNSVPQNGNFSIEFVQTAPSAGAVDIYLTTPGASLSGTTPQVSNLQFSGSIKTPLLLPAGTYEVRVTPAGNPTQVLFDVPSFSPTAASIYYGFPLDPNPLKAGSTPTIFLLQLPGSGTAAVASRSNTWQ